MIAVAGAPLAELLPIPALALPPDPRLALPVRAHADMLAFSFGGELFLEEAYLRENQELLAPWGIPIHPVRTPRVPEYPRDIGLNALSVGRYLFCNARYTAREILGLGAEIVDVAQGYAACSTLVLAPDLLVTADPSIARAAEMRGLDVLSITPGYIRLPGYDTGFIGGASAVVGNTVYFFGDPSAHPDFARIEEACARCRLKIQALLDGPLTDLGGVRLLGA